MSLVPLSEAKYASYLSAGIGHEFEDHTGSELSRDELSLIRRNVDIFLCFGTHGTSPENFLAIEELLENDTHGFGPSSTTLFFEQAFYTPASERDLRQPENGFSTGALFRHFREVFLRSRNSTDTNYLSGLNAFGYAQRLVHPAGFRTEFADLDSWETGRWEECIKTCGDAKNDPIHDEEKDLLLTEGWKDMDLLSATLASKNIDATSTNVISNGDGDFIIVHRWSVLHALREESVARKLKTRALEEAKKRDLDNETGDKAKLVLLFGAAHRRGIESKMNRYGLGYSTIMLGQESSINKSGAAPKQRNTLPDSACDVPIDGQTVRAFFAEWLNRQLTDTYRGSVEPEAFSDVINGIMIAIEDVDLGLIYEMYESYRLYARWHDEDPFEQKTKLDRRIRQELRVRDSPKKVLESYLTKMFEKSGINLDDSIARYRHKRQLDLRGFFGQH